MYMSNDTPVNQRLLSLDFMRGLIMVLLALESTGLYEHLFEASSNNSLLHGFFLQFFHHPWNGLRFWDLIQPGFMFMAGTAMAFSLHRQQQQGVPWSTSFRKVLKRSGWLFFWGVFDYFIWGNEKTIHFRLWDVLTQLSFTTLVAFLIFRWKASAQIIFCIGLLLLTEVLYRFTHVPGFDQPFTDQKNFGNYVDTLLMHTINDGGWVAINCIPTAVHTIAGVLAGKLLISGNNKIRTLITWGLISLVAGYGMDLLHITPIIKRIATSSFTLASLGWCLFCLSACYWWIDLKDHRKNLKFFTIVGMNSLFIYLFFEIVGGHWFNNYIKIIATSVLSWVNAPETLSLILSSLCIFALEWGLCYFLYTKKIFFKL